MSAAFSSLNFFVLLYSMKLRDKYKALSNAEFVKQMMVTSAYGSMQLEDQTVSRKKIELLYEKVKQENEALAERR
jgi:hypothetical protein